MSPALEDRFLMTGPPKEDPVAHFNVVRLMQICVLGLVIFFPPSNNFRCKCVWSQGVCALTPRIGVLVRVRSAGCSIVEGPGAHHWSAGPASRPILRTAYSHGPA